MGTVEQWRQTAERLLDGVLGAVLAEASGAEDGRSVEQITAAPQHWLVLARIRFFAERYSPDQASAVAVRVRQQLAVLAAGGTVTEVGDGRFALLLDRDGLEWLYWRAKPVGCGREVQAAVLNCGAVPFLPWQDLPELLAAADAAQAASPTPLGRNGMTIRADHDDQDAPHPNDHEELVR